MAFVLLLAAALLAVGACAQVIQLKPEDWTPPDDFAIGQVTGLGVDSNGHVHVFHRGSRVWDKDSFNMQNEFVQRDDGPIKEPTHFSIEPTTGRVLNRSGAGEFYMPHGLTVDRDDNIWLTDVAMHQVFKIAKGDKTPSLTVGTAFESGYDDKHFCKPTDVAVASTGHFFVADGYCNGRIVKFSPDGVFMSSFGKLNDGTYPVPSGQLLVPHSVALVEGWNMICVADRENHRIQCFSAGLASVEARPLPPGMHLKTAEHLGRVFAIRSVDHFLIGVTNGGLTSGDKQVFVVNLETGESQVYDAGLENPHDLAVTKEGVMYIGEIGPNRILRLRP